MDQLICASLSHTHYWHEMGMLKVPADVPIETVFRLKVDVEQCKHLDLFASNDYSFPQYHLPPLRSRGQSVLCVFFPFILDIKFIGRMYVCMYVWSSHIAETASTG